MRYQVTCACGQTHWVDGVAAGTMVPCACGGMVAVPSLRALRGQAAPPSDAPPAIDPAPLAAGSATDGRPVLAAEVIGPTPIHARFNRDRRSSPVLAALSQDAIWIQYTWQTRRIPLAGLAAEGDGNGTAIRLVSDPGSSAENLTLSFGSRAEAARWLQAIAIQQEQSGAAGVAGPLSPEGVSLIRGWPDAPHEVVGWVESVGPSRFAAERGLQLRAGMAGADAVVRVQRERVTGTGSHRAWGQAVRTADGSARDRLRWAGYAERARSLANRMLVVLVVIAGLTFVVAAFGPGTGVVPATGQTTRQALAEQAPWVAGLFGWPVILALWLRASAGPRLLVAAGLGVLAATGGRTLAAVTGQLLAARAAEGPVPARYYWVLADPLDWVFVLVGLALFVRALRLALAAPAWLPAARRGPPRRLARAVLVLTAIYAVGFVGFAGWAGFELGAILARPGVDPKREHQALLAFNRGLDALNGNDLTTADRSLAEALRLWEELGAGRSAPADYRANLALTLYNLGVVRERQGRQDEAEAYWARAIEVGERVGDARAAEDIRPALAEARRALAELQDFRAAGALDEKDKRAWAAYDAALVGARKGDEAAAGQFEQAIALWEEILPRANNPGYRRASTAQLAVAYLRLADLREQQGKLAESEAALGKSIVHGEAALALGPDRPLLVRDNLEMARQMLTGLRERAHREAIDRLTSAGRWADAEAAHRRGITEQEERAKAGPDREVATRILADRLERFAWFLAHCPSPSVRDTKAAVRHARRATELQPAATAYWFTLAVTQNRNGDWRDSQASLGELTNRAGALDGGGWFLTAMNLHHLRQPAEARAAFQKGVEWTAERQRQAEGDPVLRFQFELMRPALEALRREAERLLEGKDPSGDKIG